MSNYHIYEQSKDGKMVSVIFHIPISNDQNMANISYREAIIDKIKNKIDITSEVSNITSSELIRLQSGEIYEVIKSIRFSRLGLTIEEKEIEISNEFKKLSIEIQKNVENEFELYGIAKDVK